MEQIIYLLKVLICWQGATCLVGLCIGLTFLVPYLLKGFKKCK